ncbi:hypothetical protein H0H93_006337 [Arthromyces matolae]|nr:hypothetical protein H0H93_006337 [Arthromyces matolae]
MTFSGHQKEVYTLNFSADGRILVSGSSDNTVRIWDTDTGSSKVISIDDPESLKKGVTSISISPNAQYVAVATLGTSVSIWDVDTTKFVQRFRGHEDSVYSLAFTPDGRGLISASLDKTLKYWDLTELGGGLRGTPPQGGSASARDFVGHKDYVLSGAVSHDGQWVVSGSKDRTVYFWDADSANVQCVLRGHMNSVIAVALSPVGNLLVTGSGDWQARAVKRVTVDFDLVDNGHQGATSSPYSAGQKPNRSSISIIMKKILLITSWILLVRVIASPIPQDVSLPQPRSYNDEIDDTGLASSFHHGPKPSGVCLSPSGKRGGPKCPDDVTSLFSKAINDIRPRLGQPEPVPHLPWFPSGWRQEWDVQELGNMANTISQQYGNIVSRIMKDEHDIREAIAIVMGENTPELPRYKLVIEREVPAPGGTDYRDKLIKMIKNSCEGFRRAIDERNTQLERLSEIKHIRNITNPHTPNAYVTFWRENQIQLQPMAEADHLPESKYLFGKNRRRGDITKEIGLPKPMTPLALLPKRWKKFETKELIDMANEISIRFPPIRRKVMNDKNTIIRAMTALQRNGSVRESRGRPKTYPLPEKANSPEDCRKELIAMIHQSWKDLEQKVVERNVFLKKLDELQVSLDDVGNADPTNIYVAYWKESHGLPLKPASVSGNNPTPGESGTGASNAQPTTNRKRPAQPGFSEVSSSKRITRLSGAHVNGDSNSDSDEMQEEIKVSLQRNVPSSGSPNPSTPGNVQGHPDAGFQHVVGSSAHSSDLPATLWTASSTTDGPYNYVPVDPALMNGQDWAGL